MVTIRFIYEVNIILTLNPIPCRYHIHAKLSTSQPVADIMVTIRFIYEVNIILTLNPIPCRYHIHAKLSTSQPVADMVTIGFVLLSKHNPNPKPNSL